MKRLVFDIGATHSRIALTDGKALESIQRFNTDTSSNGLEIMLNKIHQYLDGAKISSLAGGFPGQLDHRTGRIVTARNLPAWVGRRIGREVSQHFGVPVEIRNDVEMVALGEAIHGAGTGCPIVAYVTVSSGVNGARITDGRIDPSRYGYEIGSQLVPGPAGRSTTLEELIGGMAMSRRYATSPASLRGNEAIWENEAAYLAVGLYNTILHWSPDIVVLGGTMMRDISIRDVQLELSKLPRVLSGWPAIVRSALADDGGLYGAMHHSMGHQI